MLDMMYGPWLGDMCMPRHMMEQVQSDEVAMVVLHALVSRESSFPKDVEGNIKLAMEYAEVMSRLKREIRARQSVEHDLEHAEHDLQNTESYIRELSVDIEKSEAKRIEASRLLAAIDPEMKSSQGKPKTQEGRRIFDELYSIEQHIARVSRDMKEAQSQLSGRVKARDQLRQKLGFPAVPEKVETRPGPEPVDAVSVP